MLGFMIFLVRFAQRAYSVDLQGLSSAEIINELLRRQKDRQACNMRMKRWNSGLVEHHA